MLTLGQYHTLAVLKALDFGYYLDAANLGEVLLPRKYAPNGLAVGDLIEVFIYLDSEDRPVATTEHPKACVGQFAFLKCVGTSKVGAFLDWGLSKDVLVPFAEQHRPMEEGHSYLVCLYLDGHDGRIVASSKIDRFLEDDRPHDFVSGQPVDLIIANSTDLGFKAIINHRHWGLLHAGDVHQRLSFGQSIAGFIKRVRPDGKIDLTLRSGLDIHEQNAATIARYLSSHHGFAALHDKSGPEEIKRVFGMSKAAFKKAVGTLLKEKRLILVDGGIRLAIESEERQATLDGGGEAELMGHAAAPPDQQEVLINREPVELYKVLKFEALVGSGGEAKAAIEDGLVLVNGQVETRKRRKIVSGDSITFGEQTLHIRLAKAEKTQRTEPGPKTDKPDRQQASADKRSTPKARPALNVSSGSKHKAKTGSKPRPATGPWARSGQKKSRPEKNKL